MVKARKYVVQRHFQGEPKRDDFQVATEELPPLKDGEILVKAEWISVDPYMRAYNLRHPTPYDQFGYQVAAVVESKAPEYKVGDKVVSHKGWRDYSILSTAPSKDPGARIYKLPDMQGLSESLGVGAVGMPGVTAYFGLLELCQPKAGETVVVTGAAGAVGSLVGQIAKIKGCKVIGFAGSDAKVQWLQKECGFDKAYNYKTVNVLQALKEAAPKGVDCFFDNVGGEDSSIILSQMNDYGRIAVCGAISSYNEDPAKMPKCSVIQPSLVFKQLKMEGFLVWRWTDRWAEALVQLIQWIASGQLKTRETVTEGFDNVFDAFSGMLNGENTGKAVVKRSPLSEYLFLPWLGATLRGLFLRQAPTAGALLYTMAVVNGKINPLFLTSFSFLFLLEARLWLEVARVVHQRWDRRDHSLAGEAAMEVETLWSNDDVQSVEVRNYVY
ncbi:hypothetical protein O0L34_g18702 [Tuta absoluta]|nr:hypothetical protein O0L34_g18702 [Tuta absoluta]